MANNYCTSCLFSQKSHTHTQTNIQCRGTVAGTLAINYKISMTTFMYTHCAETSTLNSKLLHNRQHYQSKFKHSKTIIETLANILYMVTLH